MDYENTENCANIIVSAADPVETSSTLKTPSVASNLGPEEKIEEGMHFTVSASSVIHEDADPTHIPGLATLPSVSIFLPSSSSAPITTPQWNQHPSSCSSHPDPDGQSVNLWNNFGGAKVEQTGEASGGCEKVQQQEDRRTKNQSVHRRTAKLRHKTEQAVRAADFVLFL
ncbi:hypothetical protein PDJAM_G00179040 [Pangasius djambal]|uniref:Uncharacterized protein n=1 Tax=Pangasius djambal TaxID=1691987 RepID=A0ACC5ZP66_9TELE|nr:hypothetical protein [Pangasius djambal]